LFIIQFVDAATGAVQNGNNLHIKKSKYITPLGIPIWFYLFYVKMYTIVSLWMLFKFKCSNKKVYYSENDDKAISFTLLCFYPFIGNMF